MSEGGSLLREREELILEHARLTAQPGASTDHGCEHLVYMICDIYVNISYTRIEYTMVYIYRGVDLHAYHIYICLPRHADDEDPELSRLLEALTEVEALSAERAELRRALDPPVRRIHYRYHTHI